ncbi:hypothetical protein QR685DRAFT_575274 [Neurospora intermedia]|uniref:Uncharacterized protein n=1 Tax=Neurospora intermedia TaxID=5142 RepID=A0ABR3D1S7_NEUIN
MHYRAMSDIPTYQQCVTRYRNNIEVHIALDFWTPEEYQQPITGFGGFALTDDAMSLTVPAELSAPFISNSESSENPEKEVSWKIPNVVHFRQVLTQSLTNMEFCYCCLRVIGHVLQFGRNSSGRNDVCNVKNKESREFGELGHFGRLGGPRHSRTRSKLRGTYVLQFV